jgi:hypothetical protein
MSEYENAPAQEVMKKCIPMCNSTQNLSRLFQETIRVKDARILCQIALVSAEASFGRLSNRY